LYRFISAFSQINKYRKSLIHFNRKFTCSSFFDTLPNAQEYRGGDFRIIIKNGRKIVFGGNIEIEAPNNS